ncbi:hypothetical protein E2C01_008816 [Portunus trituberculatus]|uniref:Uncharacterized protein n=1 Tax=Portunus trituberculatus TaxID=210409 RepID=A0A5B7D3C8_PORTR|nr:hypothetical protein [Portunus trituberculatus]
MIQHCVHCGVVVVLRGDCITAPRDSSPPCVCGVFCFTLIRECTDPQTVLGRSTADGHTRPIPSTHHSCKTMHTHAHINIIYK